MKPFDEKFGENVREAFDSYQEPVDERAWKQMKSRLKGRSKKGIFVMTPFFTTPLFMRAAAAIILLILASGSVWLLVLNQKKPISDTQHIAETPPIPDDLDISEPPLVSGPHAESHEVPEALPIPDALDISEPPLVSGLHAESHEESGTMPVSGIRQLSEGTPVNGVREVMESTTAADIREEPGTALASIDPYPISAISGLDLKGVTSDLVSSEQLADEADAFITSRNLESLGEAETTRDRTSIMEVSAGSMKTWSPREIAGGLGYAAGVGGDWLVGRRISIHGGGLLVYNRFSLENTLVSAKNFSDRDFASTPERDMNLGYSILQYQTSDTDVEFTAVDIPVNVRFTVREMPGSRIFLSAGFSSFLYLQQKYSSESTVLASYHRMTPQGHYVSETDYTSLITEGEFFAFRRFDFARFLNLSGGYVIRGRNQSLIVEPFLKYPLGDVTTLNLNIGMAGLSLKYLPGSR